MMRGINNVIKMVVRLKLPGVVVSNGLNGPLEFLTQCLGEELLNGHLELGAEDDRETGIDVVLLAR
jgi:hypothetical protein